MKKCYKKRNIKLRINLKKHFIFTWKDEKRMYIIINNWKKNNIIKLIILTSKNPKNKKKDNNKTITWGIR